MKNKQLIAAHIAMIVANIIWGINNPITKSVINGAVPPNTLTFFRLTGGALLFWTAGCFTPKENVTNKDKILFFFAAIFGLIFNQYFNSLGLKLSTSIDAAIVVSTLPIATMLFAAMILGEPITWMKFVGIIVGLSGALLLIFGSSAVSVSMGHDTLMGNIIIFGAVIAFGLYLTLFKNVISRYSSFTAMKWMFLFGAIMAIPLSYPSLRVTDFNSLTVDVWLRMGYVVICATFMGYALIQIGQKNLRPTTLRMYNYMQPIVASLAAVWMGIDTFSIQKGLAGVLVFAGVYIVTQSKSKAQLQNEKAV